MAKTDTGKILEVREAQDQASGPGFDPDNVQLVGKTIGFSQATIDEHKRMLEAMVPPAWKVDRYIHRTIEGKLDFDRFALARETRHNLLMPGPTGAGKTTAVIAYAGHLGAPYSGIEFDGGFVFADVIGAYQTGEEGMPRFELGHGALVVLYGGIWDWSDCNLAPPKFMSPMFPTMDQRQSLTIKEARLVIPKHKNCFICASYNPGYRGTSQMNEAFLNRFGMPLPWGYSDEVEEAIVGSRSPQLLKVVRGLRLDENMRTDIGTNVMEEFITFATHPMGDIDIAIHAFTNRFPEEEQEQAYRTLEAVRYTIANELGVDDIAFEDEATADEADLPF